MPKAIHKRLKKIRHGCVAYPVGRRAIAACVVVLLCLGIVPVVEKIYKARQPQAADVKSSVGLSSSWRADYNQPEIVLSQIETQLANTNSVVPTNLAEEIFVAPSARNIRFDRHYGVLSYECDGSAKEVYERCLTAMEDKGWNVVPLGGLVGATFIKEKGDYTWALMTFSEFEGESVVVLRLPPNSA